MKQVIVIPDSFKGTMTSKEVCEILSHKILEHYPSANVIALPVADGGEGSVDAFLSAVGGERVTVRVRGPLGEDMEAFYGQLSDGETAVVEMAACAGLPLVGDKLFPDQTTTYGVGQLMLHAIESGCKKLILGLGGSATNDFGAGAAAALGVRFLDGNGNAFVPLGGTLSKVNRVDRSGLHPALLEGTVPLTVMCDIDNPLCGPQGAAHVFGPQKGADPEMAEYLDGQLRAVAETVRRDIGVDILGLPGAGAAGGMGGGAAALLGARLQMGIETVLDTIGFDKLLENTDLVFSGEGRFDSQSLRGKAVVGIARRCKCAGVPLIAVVGCIGDGVEEAYEQGISAVFSINRAAEDFSKSRFHSKENLSMTADSLLRLMKLTKF